MSRKLTQRELIAASQRLAYLRRVEDFDPDRPGSRPTEEQQAVIDDYCKYAVKNLFVTGGNRCLAEGTLVATPKGAISIEKLQVGDIVYDENGKEQYIEAWYDQGEREVVEVWANKRLVMECTKNHDLYVSKEKNNKLFFKTRAEELHLHARPGVGTTYVHTAQIGTEDVLDAYVIGVMLGDGCCKEPRRALCISSEDSTIPQAVAKITGATEVHRQHETNYTWLVRTKNIDGSNTKPSVSYSNWFENKYAHEKGVDLECIKNWTRTSLLRLLAGIIDTDGSVYTIKDGLRLNLSMQAESVVKAAQWIFSSLWQCPVIIHEDCREKYKNGPVKTMTITNPWFVDKILQELSPFLHCERKKWRPEYACTQSSRWVPYRLGGACIGKTTRITKVYDITVTGKKNVFLLANGVISGNSGKSQLLRRFVSWFLAEPEEAPWKRRPEWNGPLLGMLVTKSHKQLEGSIVAGIKKFFAEGEIKIIRNGHYIEQLLHVKTGNVVYCFVHENSSQCRERVQSFAAHCAWLDEMPMGESGFKLLEELSKSVTDTNGVFSTHFTPKSINKQIKTYVESMKRPTGIKHSLSFVNNPGIDKEAKETRIAEIRALPVHMQETVLTGGWMKAEQAVYTVPDEALEYPMGYNPYIWRHVVCVDPGLASCQGVIVLAEDPSTGRWYVIFSEKQEKIDDNAESVTVVWDLISKHRWNVHSIVYDPSARFWYTEARKHPHLRQYKIQGPFNKNSTDRRLEMISNLQIALGTTVFIPPFNEDLLDEFTICEWSDNKADKIKKSQKFHLIDALRYGVDCLPKWGGKQTVVANTEDEVHWYHKRQGHRDFERKESKASSPNWRSGRIIGTQRVVLRR